MNADQAFASFKETRFFGSLDGLRCFCIALVLWHHSPVLAVLEDVPMILRRGFTGVDFFFVLSGFLITTLLLREHERNGRISIPGFYRRRFLRIVPVYFLVVTIAATYWIGVKGQVQYWQSLPYYYAFLSNYLTLDIPLLTPTWSLAVEEQYYLIWPLLLVLIPGRLQWRLAVTSALVLWLALTGMGVLPRVQIAPDTEIARFVLPALSFLAIILGSLAAIVVNTPKGFAIVFGLAGHRLSALGYLVVLLVLYQFLPGVLIGWPSIVMYLCMTAIILSLVVREDSILAPVLRWRPIARIGAVSYGLYLWHTPVRDLVREILVALGFDPTSDAVLLTVVFVLASFVMAELSFRYFESWFLRMKAPRPRPASTAEQLR